MEGISKFISNRLKLKVNEPKSAVARPRERAFLGFSFSGKIKDPNKRKIAPQSLKRFKDRVRQITNRNHSRSIEKRVEELSIYLRGWRGYFNFCETPSTLVELDAWIRRRLRAVLWKQWKTYRKRTKELIKRGVCGGLAHYTSKSGKGPWRISQSPALLEGLPNCFFDSLNLQKLSSKKSIQLN